MSKEERTKNKEQRAESREQRTENKEQRTENSEQVLNSNSQILSSNQSGGIDYKDKYTRLLAEFSNYQRQKEQEIKSVAQFGNSNLLIKVLDVVDDVEMGLAQEDLNKETRSILEILKSKLLHLLSLESVTEMEIKPGDEYDVKKCEVLTTIEDNENKGRISHVARKGYMIGERVLRTAKVVVGK